MQRWNSPLTPLVAPCSKRFCRRFGHDSPSLVVFVAAPCGAFATFQKDVRDRVPTCAGEVAAQTEFDLGNLEADFGTLERTMGSLAKDERFFDLQNIEKLGHQVPIFMFLMCFR